MAEEIGHFNLVDEPWIIVVDARGGEELRSLRDLVFDLPFFSRFGGELPIQSFAILRLCLAILHRALIDPSTGLPGPADFDEWRRCQEDWDFVVTSVGNYLDRWHHRFYLLDPLEPFFQVADLRTTSGDVGSLESMIVDVPTGRKFMTTRLGRSLEKISYAEAARWLVTTHAYDVSGIHSGAVGDPRVKAGKGYGIGPGWCGKLGGIHLVGRNLRETVLLNCCAFSEVGVESRADDLPAWERSLLGPAAEAKDRQPCGPIELYTWQSRRVRLVGDGDGVIGALVCQGDPVDESNRMALEPMTAWTYSKTQSEKRKVDIYRPRSHDPERAMWRGLEALLPAARTVRGGAGIPTYVTPRIVEWAAFVARYGADFTSDPSCRLRAVGVRYGVQQAVVDELVDDEVVLPWSLLEGDLTLQLTSLVLSAIDSTEHAVRSLGQLSVDLVEAAGLDPELSTQVRNRTSSRAYGRLDSAFRSWLATLSEDRDVGISRSRWHDQARKILIEIADSEINSCSPSSWTGRKVRGVWLDAATAERRFRVKIRQALPKDDDLVKGADYGNS